MQNVPYREGNYIASKCEAVVFNSPLSAKEFRINYVKYRMPIKKNNVQYVGKGGHTNRNRDNIWPYSEFTILHNLLTQLGTERADTKSLFNMCVIKYLKYIEKVNWTSK